MPKKKEKAQVDQKTEAVFARKGYRLEDKISAGAFGQVYTAVNLNSENELCAVKVMDLEKCSDKFKQKFLPRELSILIQIRHPHVIVIFDIFRSNKKIYIFMEFASNGDIAGYLKENGPLPENQTREWFAQIVDAVYFIHERLGIAHRDMKVENVLFDKNWNCKLTDFGFARECYDPKNGSLKLSETFCGTEPYYAPEIIEREAYNCFLADVWATGVVLFAMLNNKFPFHFKDLKAMLREQCSKSYKFRPDIEKELSKEVKDLQSRMFEPDVNKRITMAEVIEHPFIKKCKKSIQQLLFNSFNFKLKFY